MVIGIYVAFGRKAESGTPGNTAVQVSVWFRVPKEIRLNPL
jgi:hypothetical protein